MDKLQARYADWKNPDCENNQSSSSLRPATTQGIDDSVVSEIIRLIKSLFFLILNHKKFPRIYEALRTRLDEPRLFEKNAFLNLYIFCETLLG